MEEPIHLDTIFTTDEAAARLRLSRRGLIKLARTHGACSRNGRDYLFSEADLLALWQAMREPPMGLRFSTVPSAYKKRTLDDLFWMSYSPPTSVDRRVLGVLRWLDRQKEPKGYRDIERAGPRTIALLLGKGFVQQFGVDSDGHEMVKITADGRDQIKIFERWMKKQQARG